MIKLGVIDCGGRMSGMIKGPFRKIAPDLRVVGVVDPDEAGARSRLDDADRESSKFYPTMNWPAISSA